jgi:hypothetical protein
VSKKNKSKAKKNRQDRGDRISVAVLDELLEQVTPIQEEIEQFHIYCEAEDRMYGYSPTRMAMLTMDWKQQPISAPPVAGPVIDVKRDRKLYPTAIDQSDQEIEDRVFKEFLALGEERAKQSGFRVVP